MIALALLACGDTTEAPLPWRIVSVYDMGAVAMSQGRPKPEEEAESWLWQAAPGMTGTCGAPKGPDGMGVIEAQALSSGLTPALAIVVEEQPGFDVPAGRRAIRLAVGKDHPLVPLQPAVMPRSLAVHIEGSADIRHRQLVRTQLQMELCLEHKTGRGWIGGTEEAFRQAFLLNPSDRGGADQRYFGGQRDAVPMLLGPSDACVKMEGPSLRPPGDVPGKGSLSLVPSDVWGAWVRDCSPAEKPGAPRGGGTLPLSVAGADAVFGGPDTWDDLQIDVDGGPDDVDVAVAVRWNGMEVLPTGPLFPGQKDGTDAIGGIVDLIARVPYQYPTFSSGGHRYALLVVPNWQIVEAIRGVNGEDPAALEASDGVGWLLAHPEQLFVQVPADETASDPQYALVRPSPTNAWLNLADAVVGARGARDWGYTVAESAGSGPIVIPGAEKPPDDAVRAAHRAWYQSLFILHAAILSVVSVVGLLRLRDLWTRVPEERVDYWPGIEPEAAQPSKDRDQPTGKAP
jgi:hypothetical protein